MWNICPRFSNNLRRPCSIFKPVEWLHKLFWFVLMLQNGCCMPPETCNMDALNATFWYRRKDEGPPLETEVLYGGMVGILSDCELWRNDWSIMCYDCRSCKLGFVRAVRKKWWQLGVFLVVISILLLISHLLIFLATFWERFRGQQSSWGSRVLCGKIIYLFCIHFSTQADL